MDVLRGSWSGHGWMIWLSCAGTVLAGLAGWLVLAFALLAVEFVAIVSLWSKVRR